MRIKIVEPYDCNNRYDIKSLTPNTGPVVVASLLKQHGHDVEVISEYVTRLNIEDLNNADFIGISITTYNAERGYQIARQIKKPLVFGGFHASLMPEECLEFGDYAIIGDGHSIVKLADFLSGKAVIELNQIPNLVYRQKGKIVHNISECKAANIVPDYGLVKDYNKVNLNRLLRIPLLVNGSRGCCYNCEFCSIKAVFPDFKKKNVKLVLQDIKRQLKHQHILSGILTQVIWITDDNFSSDMNWAKRLLKELATLKIRHKLVIQARVDIARDDDLLNLMKKANIGIVYLGIESLNQKSLDRFNKEFSTKNIGRAIKRIQSHGMDVHGLFVFGDDEFKKGHGERVVDFAKEHGLSGALIQPLTPFPGTASFKRLKDEGRILHENWRDYNGKVVYRPKNLNPEELQEEIYKSYRKIYSPMHVIKFLLYGQKGFKLQVLGEAIFRHIEGFKSRNYIKDKY
ncbi:MAG: B12-binding domain-containing radical SAM protein [bacterium]|nr:B12-binding domain-containing radical SAM protein [bacterium]